MVRAFENGAVRTALDKPSHIPGHVGRPVVVFQQREGVVGSWTVRYSIIEPSEVESPASMMGVESFGFSEVLQVFVVS